MKVRMLVTLSGTRDGQPWPVAGNPIDLPDEEARDLIKGQMAIPMTNFRSAEDGSLPDGAVETRDAVEKPLTTRTGPVPARKGALR